MTPGRVTQGFMDTVTVFHGDAWCDTMAEIVALAPIVGRDMLIWEMTVPAQQKIRWGYSTPALPMNQGYMFFAFMLEGTGFDQGFLSLCVENNPRTDTRVVKRFDDNLLHTADPTTLITARSTDKNLLVPLPEMGALVGQDSRIQLRYNATVLVAEDAIGFSIPITRYMV